MNARNLGNLSYRDVWVLCLVLFSLTTVPYITNCCTIYLSFFVYERRYGSMNYPSVTSLIPSHKSTKRLILEINNFYKHVHANMTHENHSEDDNTAYATLNNVPYF